MKQFSVKTGDRPGELATLASGLGSAGINITAIAGVSAGEHALIALITNDETRTRDWLRSKAYEFHERDVLTTRLADRPGSLGAFASTLASAGVNLRTLVLTDTREGLATIAYTVDRSDAAPPAAP